MAPMSEHRIVTVTLNPAVDKVLEAPKFAVGAHVRARRLGQYPAGKGINVARVLGMLGMRCIATGFVGRGELGMFEEYLERVGEGRVVMQLLVVRGRTRDNITIMDPVFDTETHIRDAGFEVQPEDVRRIVSKVGMLANERTVMVLGGSMPPGVGLGDLRTMLHRCADQGARAVVDTGEPAVRVLREDPVWMAKLNAEELGAVAQMPTGTEEEVLAAARSVSVEGGGKVRYVVGTRGADGAVLVGPGVCLVAKVSVHPSRIANTVGCGDSLLAGLLDRWTRCGEWRSALRSGVAVATANAVSRVPGVLALEDVREFEAATIMEEPAAA